jgi:hypothetical protein
MLLAPIIRCRSRSGQRMIQSGLPITEIPLGYGMFCLTFDFTVAGYLMMSDTAWDEPGTFDIYFWQN